MLTAHENVSFPSGDLTLEGAVHLPQGLGRFPAVAICHPHPRRGGDLRNTVVSALAGSLREAGIAALRFNFRGVGSSGGAFDGGVGEIQDAAAAVTYLTLHDRVDASRVGIAGYSFGGWMALAASDRGDSVQAVASIACPVRAFRELGVQKMLSPKLLLVGDLDHDFPTDQFRFLARRYSEPRQVEVVQGADHFFVGREMEVAEVTAKFFVRWLRDRV